MPRVGAIILAAGESSRLGQPKQLLSFRGTTLLRHAVQTALSSVCRPVAVVLGAHFEMVTDKLNGLPIEIVKNEAWRDGMSSSLRMGLAAVESEVDAVILMLCDQPLVSVELLNRLATSNSSLAAAEYGG